MHSFFPCFWPKHLCMLPGGDQLRLLPATLWLSSKYSKKIREGCGIDCMTIWIPNHDVKNLFKSCHNHCFKTCFAKPQGHLIRTLHIDALHELVKIKGALCRQ